MESSQQRYGISTCQEQYREFFNLNIEPISDLEAKDIFKGLDKNTLTLKITQCKPCVFNII